MRYFYIIACGKAMMMMTTLMPLNGNAADPPSPPLVIAHRGDSIAFPENTLSAIRSAIAAKADLIEFDVRAIEDGSLYLFHDADLKRFGLGEIPVSGLSPAEAEAVDAGSWHGKKFSQERPPTLRAAIQMCLDGGITPLIERKTGTPGKYLKVIQDLKAEDRVIVQAFDWDFLTALRKQSPGLRIGALSGDPLDEEKWKKLVALKPEWVGWKAKELSQELIVRFQKAKFQVAVWTVNDRSDIELFSNRKVNAIITDRPAQAKEWISR